MRDERPGYEPTDADAGRTYGAGLAILAAMILTALGLVPVFKMLGRRESAAQPPPAAVVKTEMSEPALSFPKLVTSEPQALAELHGQEDGLLTSYGWVEKDKGVARIPIEHAMRIVAAQGLPRFEAPPPAAGRAAGGERK
jgi:hypothetical protein